MKFKPFLLISLFVVPLLASCGKSEESSSLLSSSSMMSESLSKSSESSSKSPSSSSKSPSSSSSSGMDIYKKLGFEDPHYSYFAVGADQGIWNAEESTKMEPASIYDVSRIDNSLASSLMNKNVQYLYMCQVKMGVNSSGWAEKCLYHGEEYEADGSLNFKAVLGPNCPSASAPTLICFCSNCEYINC